MQSATELLPALLVVAAVLGLAVGSFLNVVIHRLPLGLSLSHPGSRCPSCGTPIKARHNVPVFGWLVLRGRCHTCRAPIGVRYPLVEAGTGGAFVAVTAALVTGARDDGLAVLAPVPAWLWLTACLVAATLIDKDGHRVPTRFAAVTPAVAAVLLVATGAPAGAWGSVGRAVVGGVVVAAGVAVVLRGRVEVIGLAAAVGLCLGAVSWLALGVGGVLCVGGAAAGLVSSRRVPVVALLSAASAIGLIVAVVTGY